MQKINTLSSKNNALNWLVAKAEGLLTTPVNVRGRPCFCVEIDEEGELVDTRFGHPYAPSKYWSQGGPIVTRENLKLTQESLELAMQMYVAKKLGKFVEVPVELANDRAEGELLNAY